MFPPRLGQKLMLAVVAAVGIGRAVGQEAAESPAAIDVERPASEACAQVRAGLDRARARFAAGSGHVVFLGGSITRMGAERDPGWANLVQTDLQARFPECTFRFDNVGIPSIGSVGHAHRFERDVLEGGRPDLLVVEAAVNDLHNGRDAKTTRRAFEGVVRSAALRSIDVLVLHFADTAHLAAYAEGDTPEVIAWHEAVARHYRVPSLDLARHIAEEIGAGRMDWQRDFGGDCHVPALGQRLYAAQVRHFLDAIWNGAESPADAREAAVPPPLDDAAYVDGHLLPPARAIELRGARVVDGWRPEDGAATRPGFVDVPVLDARGAGSGFALNFRGTGAGLWLVSGPDAARIRYRVDGGSWREFDAFTRHSGRLHLPRPQVLCQDLDFGAHRLEVEILERSDAEPGGDALRAVYLLEHGAREEDR